MLLMSGLLYADTDDEVRFSITDTRAKQIFAYLSCFWDR